MPEIKGDSTAAIAELVSLKTKIEQESSEIIEERDKLIDQLRSICSEKEAHQMKNSDAYRSIQQYGPELLAAKRQVELLANHVAMKRNAFEASAQAVLDQLNMSSFVRTVDDLKSSIDSALSFYDEDNLQMELMKKNSTNRDLRVELTRVSGEIEQRRKEIQAEIEEKMRLKKAEMERQKQEEERKRIIAEESARKASMLQSPVPTSPDMSMHNFRSVTFAGRSPEPSISYKSSLPGERALSPVPGGPKTSNSNLPSFSQITRGW